MITMLWNMLWLKTFSNVSMITLHTSSALRFGVRWCAYQSRFTIFYWASVWNCVTPFWSTWIMFLFKEVHYLNKGLENGIKQWFKLERKCTQKHMLDNYLTALILVTYMKSRTFVIGVARIIQFFRRSFPFWKGYVSS